MTELLFVNACMRGEESNTLALCREYLATRSDAHITEVPLAVLGLTPFNNERVEYRVAQLEAGNADDAVFDLAKQFAHADEVVIGAPYWDLSFPAALKVYIEYVTVCGVTFCYGQMGNIEGMCKAQSLTYITTSGGPIGDRNFGYDYVCGMARMFGIEKTCFVSAEGLDIIGADVEAEMNKARTQLGLL